MPNTFYNIGSTVGYEGVWTDYDTSVFGPAAFMKDASGIVRFKGMIAANPVSSGALNDLLFVMPPGFRPARGQEHLFNCISFETVHQATRIDVVNWDEAGTQGVYYRGGGRQWISLANIQYLAEG